MDGQLTFNADGVGTIHAGNHDISDLVTAVNVHCQAGRSAILTAHMHIRLVRTDVSGSVRVDAETHDALVALGWTPPKEDG